MLSVWAEKFWLSRSWEVVGPCMLLWSWGISSRVSYLFTMGRPVVLGGSKGVGSWQRGELGVAGSVSMPFIMMNAASILWVMSRVLSGLLDLLKHRYIFDMRLPTGG